MGIVDAALQGIGSGIQAGVKTYGEQQDRALEERRLAQQAELANKKLDMSEVIQDLRDAGVLAAIEARRGSALDQLGAKHGYDVDSEDNKQGNRVEMAGVNFDHAMSLAGFNQGAADTRNIRDNTTRMYGIDTGATTQRRGQDVTAATQRRGQDIGASTQQRGQDLTFGAGTYATDSANRRTLVPRGTQPIFGGSTAGEVKLPPPSYEQFFQPPPTAHPTPTRPAIQQSPAGSDRVVPPTPSSDPTAPVSAQPQIKFTPPPGPAIAPVPPPRPPAAVRPQAVAPMPPTLQQPSTSVDRQTPQSATGAQALLKGMKPARYTLTDGSVWIVRADGSIAPDKDAAVVAPTAKRSSSPAAVQAVAAMPSDPRIAALIKTLRPGHVVRIRDGRTVTITRINSDGTFDYDAPAAALQSPAQAERITR